MAVVWNGTTPTILGTTAGEQGGSSVYAYGINASGQVVGTSYHVSNPPGVAVVWNGTTPTVLPGQVNGSTATAINDSGQVAGISYYFQAEAVVWNGTTLTVLNGLGGQGSGGGASGAYGINASGQVVGYSYTAGDASKDAVVWNGTTPTILGSLGGNTSAAGINDSGQVVGTDSVGGAFIYTGGTMYALDNLLVPGSGSLTSKSHPQQPAII